MVSSHPPGTAQARYEELGCEGDGRLRVACLLGGETIATASGADFKVSQPGSKSVGQSVRPSK